MTVYRKNQLFRRDHLQKLLDIWKRNKKREKEVSWRINLHVYSIWEMDMKSLF
jgi:hypothetical protein